MPRTTFGNVLYAFLRLVRRPFPASVRRRVRLFFFQWLDLKWDLSFDLRVRLASYHDWVVYNEIFVHGDYDRALCRALDTAARQAGAVTIVDMGANVGFFTLRTAQQLRQRGMENRGSQIIAIEGHPDCVKEFETRIFTENNLSRMVTLIGGLVGNRTGEATLYGDSLFRREKRTVTVPFVDLNPFFTAVQNIDLLKCDIEGSELLFIENYPDLLRKVKVAVFELHSKLCDTRRCQELLTEYGFTHSEIQRAGDYSLYCVWR